MSKNDVNEKVFIYHASVDPAEPTGDALEDAIKRLEAEAFTLSRAYGSVMRRIAYLQRNMKIGEEMIK